VQRSVPRPGGAITSDARQVPRVTDPCPRRPAAWAMRGSEADRRLLPMHRLHTPLVRSPNNTGHQSRRGHSPVAAALATARWYPKPSSRAETPRPRAADRKGTSNSAAKIKAEHAADPARPWPSVENRRRHRPSQATNPVRYASVDTATRRPAARHDDTRRDTEETARQRENTQLAGRFRRWWQVLWQLLGSNQRRLSRRFYREPIPAHGNGH
jgi:hypothetical protein